MPSLDLSDIDGWTSISSLPPPSQYHLHHLRTQSSSNIPTNIINMDDETFSKPEAEDLVSDSAKSSDHPAAKKWKKEAIHPDDMSKDGLSKTELDLSKCIQYCDPGMLTDLYV